MLRFFVCILVLTSAYYVCSHNYAQIPGEYMESASVSALFADPDHRIDSPAFRSDPINYTSHSAMRSFLQVLQQTTPHLRMFTAGCSQDGQEIPLLRFSQVDSSELDKRKPTILIIGLQHWNEPAGGEAALAIASELANNATYLQQPNILVLLLAGRSSTVCSRIN